MPFDILCTCRTGGFVASGDNVSQICHLQFFVTQGRTVRLMEHRGPMFNSVPFAVWYIFLSDGIPRMRPWVSMVLTISEEFSLWHIDKVINNIVILLSKITILVAGFLGFYCN